MKRGLRLRGFSVRRSLPPGFLTRDMKRNRSELRAGVRAARKEARKARQEGGLCMHGDDERLFSSHAEAEADGEPVKVCEECGRPKLIVKCVNVGVLSAEVCGVPTLPWARALQA
jgi:hypothetical protein